MTAIDERALGAAIIEGSNMAGERLVTQIVTAYLEALGPGSTGEAEGWRDIKSAPKDRHVMLFGKHKLLLRFLTELCP